MLYFKYRKGKEIRTMTRDEMLTEVIRKWGFEHEFTIRFATACEKWHTEKAVELLYRWTMALDPEVWE